MDTSGFKITALNFYNYSKELSGSITLHHGANLNEIKLQLNAADCSKIINIVADRVAETIHEAARQFWVDVGMPAREFMPVEAKSSLLEAEVDPTFEAPNDETPF